MTARILLLPGDGIGPEVVEPARLALLELGRRFDHRFEFETQLIGDAAYQACGNALPESVLSAARRSQAVLLGAVGSSSTRSAHDPISASWPMDTSNLPAPGATSRSNGREDGPAAMHGPEEALLRLRSALGLYLNLRPIRAHHPLLDCSPLRAEAIADTDILIVRELTGGIYFGTPRGRRTGPDGLTAFDTLVYDEHEIRRVVVRAFEEARRRRRKLASVDKANVLESSRLWREVTTEVGRQFPEVELTHNLVDSCAMRLISQPRDFDVIVTENMFGDILSDEAGVIGGSLGLLPSASLGDGLLGLYEPIHGSAPDIAGKNLANPVGTILSAALLLRHSLGLDKEALALEAAVEQALSDGCRTKDLSSSGYLSTEEMGKAVIERIRA